MENRNKENLNLKFPNQTQNSLYVGGISKV